MVYAGIVGLLPVLVQHVCHVPTAHVEAHVKTHPGTTFATVGEPWEDSDCHQESVHVLVQVKG